jgi:hypothetical protein
MGSSCGSVPAMGRSPAGAGGARGGARGWAWGKGRGEAVGAHGGGAHPRRPAPLPPFPPPTRCVRGGGDGGEGSPAPAETAGGGRGALLAQACGTRSFRPSLTPPGIARVWPRRPALRPQPLGAWSTPPPVALQPGRVAFFSVNLPIPPDSGDFWAASWRSSDGGKGHQG